LDANFSKSGWTYCGFGVTNGYYQSTVGLNSGGRAGHWSWITGDSWNWVLRTGETCWKSGRPVKPSLHQRPRTTSYRARALR